MELGKAITMKNETKKSLMLIDLFLCFGLGRKFH